jgi:hypothetical protein
VSTEEEKESIDLWAVEWKAARDDLHAAFLRHEASIAFGGMCAIVESYSHLIGCDLNGLLSSLADSVKTQRRLRLEREAEDRP